MARLHPEYRKALLDALLDEDRVAKRATTDAANEGSVADSALEGALCDRPKWWLPKYGDQAPSRAGWQAFAERRRRFATGMRDLSVLTAIVAWALPDPVGRWMFIGFSIAIALVWAWQLDVSNRELAALTALPEWPRGTQVPAQGDAAESARRRM